VTKITAPSPDKNLDKNNDAEDAMIDAASLLPDLPSLSHTRASLVGGTIRKVDHVRDQITVQIFGSGKMKILYDPRTKILQGTELAAPSALQVGDRVYVDTVLDGTSIFARNIRLVSAAMGGRSEGVVVSYQADRGELLVRDQLSPDAVKFRIDSRTEITQGGRVGSAGDLVPGTLVSVDFAASKQGRDAHDVAILAVPGSSFTFSGEVSSLDLHLGLLVLKSNTDHKTYEISLDPEVVPVGGGLRAGADVTAVTNFDGTRYTAKTLTVNSH
jgi:hypothetical protein